MGDVDEQVGADAVGVEGRRDLAEVRGAVGEVGVVVVGHQGLDEVLAQRHLRVGIVGDAVLGEVDQALGERLAGRLAQVPEGAAQDQPGLEVVGVLVLGPVAGVAEGAEARARAEEAVHRPEPYVASRSMSNMCSDTDDGSADKPKARSQRSFSSRGRLDRARPPE